MGSTATGCSGWFQTIQLISAINSPSINWVDNVFRNEYQQGGSTATRLFNTVGLEVTVKLGVTVAFRLGSTEKLVSKSRDCQSVLVIKVKFTNARTIRWDRVSGNGVSNARVIFTKGARDSSVANSGSVSGILGSTSRKEAPTLGPSIECVSRASSSSCQWSQLQLYLKR